MLITLKRSVSVLIVLILLLTTACEKKVLDDSKVEKNENAYTIVTAFYPIYQFTRNIVVDIPGVEVVNLAPPQTGCLHDYVITPKDMKVLENADVLIINGGGMEQFMDQVIKSYPNLKVIEASRNIEMISDEHGKNPHVWVGVSGAIAEIENIASALESLDVKNKEAYDKNEKAYIAKLSVLKDKMANELKPYEGKKIVTFHEAFPYFAKEFNLEIATVIEREPGSEPTASELSETIQLIDDSDVHVLFAEPQYPNKAAELIAKETGALIYELDPFVTGTNNDPLDSYEKVMLNNLNVLKEAFSK